MAVRDSKRDAAKSVPAPAGYMRLLLRQFGTTPEMRKALMAGVDIDEAALAKPGAEATLYSFITFSTNLNRIVGEDWPLQASAVWGTATQGALEVAVRSAATVGDGMDILARYGHVRGPYLGLRLVRDKTKTTLLISSAAPVNETVFHAMSQTAAMSAKSMLDPVLEEARDAVVYQFPGKAPEHAESLRAVLGGTVNFNQRHYAIVITNAVCAKASPYADQDLLATALTELEQAARRIRGEDTLTLRVERLLKRKRTGRLSEDEAARELGLSRRTLVRRLAASGTSYRALLDANLKQRARQLLDADKHSRADMAEMLGFEDPTSFSRACRRWFKGA
jgi:AraC-like DNA-binding protein